ncbi:MAG: glycine zipper family protein [Burkholderiaceae bacterium]|nr:glycine zipper family protein [Burkholderiaceae bacterium]
MPRRSLVLAAAAALCLAGVAGAQQQFVYPAKGQSSEQQKKDEYECHQWAVQQTGFDPSKPAATPPPASTATGPAKGSAVKGAVVGAVVGEVVSDDAGAGAAAGAVAGRSQSRRQNTAQAQQQQQAAAQQTQQKQASYSRARSACLEGRGYSIK